MRRFVSNRLVTMLADFAALVLSGILSGLLLDFLAIDSFTSLTVFLIALDAFLSFFLLFVFGAYHKPWKRIAFKDVVLYCLVVLIANAALASLNRMISEPFSPFFYLFAAPLGMLAIMLVRGVGVKLYYAFIIRGSKRYDTTVLVVGAGSAGEILVHEIQSAQEDGARKYKYHILGMVDDDMQKLNTSVHGIPVLAATKDIPEICRHEQVDIIFFAIPSCTKADKNRILNLCNQTKCKVKIIPSIGQLIEKHSFMQQSQDIRIEDLLGRDAITFDRVHIAEFVQDKVCMVTGGGGSIGSELARQIASFRPKQLILIDIYENNAYEIQQELCMEYGSGLDLVVRIASVRDHAKMEYLFQAYQPEIVFHAAAHKHVPLMEDAPEEAVKNNVFGTWNTAALAMQYHSDKFVLISTDKAVNPTNVMGATKRLCEMIVQGLNQESSHTEFVAVRFGNVLGSNGSVIPLFRRQIESGNPITITHPDIIRYFMTISEAVSLVLEAGAMAKGGEIFVLDMGSPVKILDLAENLIRMYGKEPYEEVKIRFTGLRPGEKLYEELLMDEEGLESTKNKKIFIGNQIDVDLKQLRQQLDRLQGSCNENNPDDVVSLMKQIVPTYKSAEHERDGESKEMGL